MKKAPPTPMKEDFSLAVEEASSEGVWVLGPDRKVAFSNRRMAEMLGLEREEVLGRDCMDFLEQESARRVGEKWSSRRESRETAEVRFRQARGPGMLASVRWVPVLGPKGKLRGVVWTALDVTEIKKLEDENRKEKDFLDRLIDLNPYSIQVYDKDGHHLRANKAYMDHFISPPPPEYCWFDDPIAAKMGFHEENLKIREGKVFRGREMWYNPRWVKPDFPDVLTCFRYTVFPIMDSANRMENFVMMFEDVTEEKKAKADLIKRMEDLSNLFDIAEALVNSKDLKTTLDIIIHKVNAIVKTKISAIRLFNQESQELVVRAYIGIPDHIIPRIPLKAGEGLVGEAFEKGAPVLGENLEDDRRFDYYPLKEHRISSEIAVPLKIGEEALGVLACCSEEPRTFSPNEVKLLVSAANLAAVAIRNAQLFEDLLAEKIHLQDYAKALEAANNAKTQFLSMVSHELRTPLASILGYTFMLKHLPTGSPVGDAEERAVDVIDRQAHGLKSIINDILDISRIEAGKKLRLEMKRCDLAALAREAVESLKPLAEKKGLRLELEAGGDIPAISAHPQRMAQVFFNLIGNALKFTPKGLVRVRLFLKGDQVVCSVEDTGIGIRKDLLEKIFEKFYQVDSSTTRPFGGTGLGLTISREILQAHNGNVWAESEPGKGSTFTFFIPLTPGKAAAEPFLHPASSKPEPPPFRQDVLIIDDDPAILELLENILREEGFEVRTAKDGLDGMNQVFNRPPDLILLDVRMPKIDGFDLCRFIKGSSTTKSIPVIMLTAAGQASEIEMGAKSGAEEYIVKPFEPDDMLAKVKKWTQPETGDS